MLAIARSRVSCTRSSARSTLPHKEIAKARKLGTAESIASPTDGRIVISAIHSCPDLPDPRRPSGDPEVHRRPPHRHLCPAPAARPISAWPLVHVGCLLLVRALAQVFS